MQPIDPLPPIVILSEEPRSESKNLVPYIKFAEKPVPKRTAYPFPLPPPFRHKKRGIRAVCLSLLFYSCSLKSLWVLRFPI